MSGTTPAIPERLHELLADRALGSLDESDAGTLDALLAEHDDLGPDVLASYDASAAALAVAFARGHLEPLPAVLFETVRSDARAWSPGAVAAAPLRLRQPAPGRTDAGPSWSIFRVAPWVLAAAAVLFAVLVWLPGGSDVRTTDELVRTIDADPAARRLGWSSPVGLEVEGGVAWSGDLQAGYMTLRGLPANPPSDHQYQLWIFDKRRSTYQAVDGGVFDVPAGAEEIVVPIDAKLEVFDPTLFAVTTEPPGGVVVHDPKLDPDRYRIVLTAPVE